MMGNNDLTPIAILPPALLQRRAIVYVRQSTQSQVMTNLESQRRQYDLVSSARQYGFQTVDVIDDDLGISASGSAARPGFERLVAALYSGEVGRVAIDNNAAERALRPIGVGRRNWLFAGSDAGGETLARAMTIIETAKMNGLDPQAYLADILDRINDHMNPRLDELLPWNWAPKAAPQEQAA